MYELVVETDFAAAHRLRGYEGLCENLHGHNWKVEVSLQSNKLDDLGMVIDFKVIKGLLSQIIERLDHKYLNELEEFKKKNPTTENISKFICIALQQKIKQDIKVTKIQIWESVKASAAYIPATD